MGQALSSNPSGTIVALARLYFDIAVWRRGPQDVPASPLLLPGTALAYGLVALFSSLAAAAVLPASSTANRGFGVLIIVADILFVMLWYWLLLRFAGRRERFAQTTTALFGAATVLTPPSVVTVQLVFWSMTGSGKWLAPFALMAAIAVLVWSVLANAHVLRHALEQPLRWCVPLVVLQLFVEQMMALSLVSLTR
jgi:hypothetical protein